MKLAIDRPASPETVAAIAAAIGAVLAEEAQSPEPAPALEPWRVAARVESLGLVRRIPGQLDLRYMTAPTRERLSRAQRP